MEEHLISYNEINFYARMIARRLKDKENVTHVVGLARGGLIPATIISYALELPLITIHVTSYEGKERKGVIGNCNNLFDLPKNSKLLIVDDICDSGQTTDWVKEQLSLLEIKHEIACIYTKEKHTNRLDHYGMVVPDNKWIVFPWE